MVSCWSISIIQQYPRVGSSYMIQVIEFTPSLRYYYIKPVWKRVSISVWVGLRVTKPELLTYSMNVSIGPLRFKAIHCVPITGA